MTDESTISPEERAAAVIEASFERIFEVYERRLADEQNLLAVGKGAGETLREQARSLLEQTAEALRDENGEKALEAELRRDEEAAKSPLVQHPDEAFRAGAALCAAVMEVVLAEEDFSGEPPETVASLSLNVQRCLMDHVARVSMASYVDYLLAKIGEVQSEERARFSRDLHDNVAHSMALVKQNLEIFAALRKKDEAAAEAKLTAALESSEEAISLARDMSLELRQTDSEDSLRVALDNLVRASVPPGIEVEVEVSEDEIPAHIRDQIYMILREGLRNAVSHSGGERVRMKVAVFGEEVSAAVEDWGAGFDPDSEEGVGLRSMRERAKLMRGSLDLTSTPGEGTRAEVRVPLKIRRT